MRNSRRAVSRFQLDSLESRVLLSSDGPALGALHSPHQNAATQLSYFGKSAHFSFGGKTLSSSTTLLAPGNVLASINSSGKVALTWSASSGAAGYYVYRSTNGGTYAKVASLGLVVSYTDTSVAAGTAYSYYLVAYKQKTLSGKSSIASVTTPAPTMPNAPSNLAVTSTTSNAVSLAWTDNATNETGYDIYRSSDGVTFSLVASVAANSTGYTDAGLMSGMPYSYKIGAYNSAGEALSTAVAGTTATVVPSGTPINISLRYGNELVLAGTSGNDSIYVSESGAMLTITANGTTTTAAVPANGLFIYSDGGSDTITVDSSVTLRTTIASIDGSATTVSNSDANASIWIDSSDGFSGVGSVHKVASFYENVSKAIGINIADPTDAGSTFRANASLWGSGPVMGDVNQGGVGDCYFVSSLAAFANNTPTALQNMAVDLGDGTYVVQYLRGGTPTFVRVDGDLSSGPYWGYAYNHVGASGDIWACIMEKSYAYFRSGANTYSSLNSGWMSAVYSDFGVANTSVNMGLAENSFYSTLSNALAAGKPVTFGTFGSPPNLVGSHAYTLVSTSIGSGGQTLYRIRNPWGQSGDSLEDANGYATLTYSQMLANFQSGTMAV